MNTIETIEAIRRCNSNCSDYRIAKLMGIGANRVSMYLHGKTTMTEEHRVTAAKLLNQDPEQQLIYGRMERTKCPEAKTAWRRALEKLTSAAAGVLLAFGLTVAPGETPAQDDSEATNNIHYAHWFGWIMILLEMGFLLFILLFP